MLLLQTVVQSSYSFVKRADVKDKVHDAILQYGIYDATIVPFPLVVQQFMSLCKIILFKAYW